MVQLIKGDLASRLKEQVEANKEKLELMKPTSRPIWTGPNGEGEQGGITFSLLSRYLVCKERFRLLVIEGLKPHDYFNHRLSYGNLFHLCEEIYTKSIHDPTVSKTWKEACKYELNKYEVKLKLQYPLDREVIEHWTTVCWLQFQEYVKFWEAIGDTVKRTSLAQEKVFDVRYKLPSGRFVRLRGKWDGIDLLNENREDEGLYVFDHKTKGDPDQKKITKELNYDLQMMMYVIALQEYNDESFWNRRHKRWRSIPIRGVRYNIIKRPLSGGKGTIVRHKARGTKPEETKESYYKRVLDYIQDEPSSYFMRWKVELNNQDIENFKKECLDPILESLCNWYDLVQDNCIDDAKYLEYGLHYRTPYNIYNVLLEGGSSEYDEYLLSGSTLGLTRCTDLFPELRS